MLSKKVSHFKNARSMIRASSGQLTFAETEITYLISLGSRLEQETNERLDKIKVSC